MTLSSHSENLSRVYGFMFCMNYFITGNLRKERAKGTQSIFQTLARTYQLAMKIWCLSFNCASFHVIHGLQCHSMLGHFIRDLLISLSCAICVGTILRMRQTFIICNASNWASLIWVNWLDIGPHVVFVQNGVALALSQSILSCRVVLIVIVI